MSDDAIPPEVDVLRVIKPKMAIHVPEGARYPTWEAMRPTEEDKERLPVRVSVWDSRRTSVTEAVALRVAATQADPARTNDEDFLAFALEVAAVRDVGAELNNQRMRVVRDPDGIVQCIALLPGADGHSGIEGLDREPGTPKADWKKLLGALARKCRPAGAGG